MVKREKLRTESTDSAECERHHSVSCFGLPHGEIGHAHPKSPESAAAFSERLLRAGLE